MSAKPGDEIKPSRYRKLPVEISAIRWSGTNLREVIDFTGLHPSAEKWTWEEYEEVVRTQGLKLFTLEKSMMASVGDYIIKGVAGEVYACKPDIFWRTYERASSARPEAQRGGLPTEKELYDAGWVRRGGPVLVYQGGANIAPTAVEYYNPETGHAVLEYSTIAPLLLEKGKESGYIKRYLYWAGLTTPAPQKEGA